MANDENLQRADEKNQPDLSDPAADFEVPPPPPKRKPGRPPQVQCNVGVGAGGSHTIRREQEEMVTMTRAELNALMAAAKERGRGGGR